MGLVIGIIICILAFPIGFAALFMSGDYNTGTQTRSLLVPAAWFFIPLAIGGLFIYSHWYPIGW